jgi:hypothetical protein
MGKIWHASLIFGMKNCLGKRPLQSLSKTAQYSNVQVKGKSSLSKQGKHGKSRDMAPPILNLSTRWEW